MKLEFGRLLDGALDGFPPVNSGGLIEARPPGTGPRGAPFRFRR